MKQTDIFLFILLFITRVTIHGKAINVSDSLVINNIFEINELIGLKMSYRVILDTNCKVLGLDLNGLGIDTLPEAIKTLTHLKRIDLRGNKFKVIPKVISEMPNLHEIKWKNKNVTIFRNNGVSKIIMNENKVKNNKSNNILSPYKNSFSINPIIATAAIAYLTMPDITNIYLPFFSITFERNIISTLSINMNISLDLFETYPNENRLKEERKMALGYGARIGHRFYPNQNKEYYLGLDMGLFILPKNFYYRDKCNDQLSNYFSVGFVTGRKISFNNRINAFLELSLFPLVMKTIIEGSIYQRPEGSDRFGIGAINEAFTEIIYSNLLPNRGFDLNLGIGINF